MYNRNVRGGSNRGRVGRSQRKGGRRGRGLNRGSNTGVSPLNRIQNQLSPNKPRGQGRGRINLRGGRGRGRGAALAQRIQNKTAGVTNNLNQRRQKAIKTLIQAKSTLAKLNAQRRKTARINVVNQRRGLQASNLNRSFSGSTLSLKSTSSQRRRGFGSTMSLSSVGSRGTGRLSRFGSTISLSTNASSGSRKQKRRRWRQPQTQGDDPILTISVNNPKSMSPPAPPSPVRRGRGRGGPRGGGGRKNFLKRLPVAEDSDPVLAAQIANLRPAVSQRYNFKKAVFSQAHTSVSLSDRFGTGASGELTQEGRKVFF